MQHSAQLYHTVLTPRLLIVTVYGYVQLQVDFNDTHTHIHTRFNGQFLGQPEQAGT